MIKTSSKFLMFQNSSVGNGTINKYGGSGDIVGQFECTCWIHNLFFFIKF